jgi:hypothetical protein
VAEFWNPTPSSTAFVLGANFGHPQPRLSAKTCAKRWASMRRRVAVAVSARWRQA